MWTKEQCRLLRSGRKWMTGHILAWPRSAGKRSIVKFWFKLGEVAIG